MNAIYNYIDIKILIFIKILSCLWLIKKGILTFHNNNVIYAVK